MIINETLIHKATGANYILKEFTTVDDNHSGTYRAMILEDDYGVTLTVPLLEVNLEAYARTDISAPTALDPMTPEYAAYLESLVDTTACSECGGAGCTVGVTPSGEEMMIDCPACEGWSEEFRAMVAYVDNMSLDDAVSMEVAA